MEPINGEIHRCKDTDLLLNAEMLYKDNDDPANSADIIYNARLSFQKHYEIIRLGIYTVQHIHVPGVEDPKDDPILIERTQPLQLSKF